MKEHIILQLLELYIVYQQDLEIFIQQEETLYSMKIDVLEKLFMH